MTNKLKEAFETASRLPAGEQDALASAILEEIENDARWTASLAAHPEALGRLADEALAEHRAGRTKPLVPDDM